MAGLVRRIQQVVGGGVNALTESRVGLAVSNVIDVVLGDGPQSGVAARMGPLSVSTPTQAGVAASVDVDGSTANESAAGMTATALVVAATPAVADASSGVRLGLQRIDLSRASGATAVTENAKGGRTDWANDNNALGTNDGTTATFSGNAVAARGGELELTFADWTGKDDLTIDTVELHYYVAQAGTALGNGTLICEHQIVGGSRMTDLDPTDNEDYLTTPFTVDLSGEVGVLSDLDGLTVWIGCQTAALNTHTAQVDAVEIVVTAHNEVTP